MLLWQLKNVRNRYLLWVKLLACSFAIHLLFVGIIFFGYRDSATSHKFTMHNHNINTQVTVVLVPTAHAVHASTVSTQQGVRTNKTTRSAPIANQKKAATQIAQAKPVPTKKPTPKKVIPAKAVPKKNIPAKSVPVKTAPAKAPQKKVTPAKPIPAKPVPQKTPPVKIESTEAKPPEKVTPEKPVPVKSEPQKVEPIKTESAKIEKQPEVSTNAVERATIEKPPLSNELYADNESITIEVPYAQAREFYQQEALRKELSRHWTPPHGIPDTCSCEITTYVGNNGVVTDSVITQPSGILMYDVSARAAILAMELPRWTWGSSFTVTLKP